MSESDEMSAPDHDEQAEGGADAEVSGFAAPGSQLGNPMSGFTPQPTRPPWLKADPPHDPRTVAERPQG